MRLVDTSHLGQWADSMSARGVFPYLIKRLICMSVNPQKLRFPACDAVWVPGYDGEVHNGDIKDRFVPEGFSVWEAGVGEPKKKASEDYQKRSSVSEQEAGTPENRIDKTNTTFVFVTPRIWPDKEAWVTKKKAEGVWKDVVVIDATELVDWIERHDAVTLWFSAQLGLTPENGMEPFEKAWEIWQHYSEPPMVESLVLAGREEQARDLVNRLSQEANIFTVQGDSPSEALGFVLAAMKKGISEEDQYNFSARTIVVENEKIAQQLHNLKNHIILIKQAGAPVSGNLSHNGCHVIIAAGNDANTSPSKLIGLTRATRREFVEALTQMGMPPDIAEERARECGLNITVLQRLLASGNYRRPAWAAQPLVGGFIPFLLAGRWVERSKEDCSILCRLADVEDYAKVEEQLYQYLTIDEAPLKKFNEMCLLTSAIDAFQLSAKFITRSHLNRFAIVFKEVFSTIDRKVELQPEERFFAFKEEGTCSGSLRMGLADTLLLFAQMGRQCQSACLPDTYVDELVRGITGINADWRVLASLRDQYVRLMEAAPDPLMNSLECLLEAKCDDLRMLFIEGTSVFGGGPMHTGLLWGLEILAWNPEYLLRVSLILAQLAKIDPGGRYSNRPINSLKNIFMWHNPGTNADNKQRLEVIDAIIANEPTVGWELLKRLLPKPVPTIVESTAKPRFSDYGDIADDSMTVVGRKEYINTIIDRTIGFAEESSERWDVLLRALRTFDKEQQSRVFNLLNEIVEKNAMDADQKLSFWKMLREFIKQQRFAQSAVWALKNEQLEQLEVALNKLNPDNLIQRHKWLFDEWTPVSSLEEDFKESEKKSAELRKVALSEIFLKQGIRGVIELGIVCEYPGIVAENLVVRLNEVDEIWGVVEQLAELGEEEQLFAGHISNYAESEFGGAWKEKVEKQVKENKWLPRVAAGMILGWPNKKDTWLFADKLGKSVAAEFWKRVRVFGLAEELEERAYQIDKLIEAGRAVVILNRLAFEEYNMAKEMLLRIFDAAAEEINKADSIEELRKMDVDNYKIRSFLGKLRKRPDIKNTEIAQCEFKVLGLFSHDMEGLAIHELIAEDPELFVDLLCKAFKSDSHSEAEEELDQIAQNWAVVSYRLLQGMDKIPGERNGSIDDETLAQWVDGARTKAQKVGRLDIADQKIGEVLGRSKEDPNDNMWPIKAIRNVIEKTKSPNLENGFVIGRYNSRGCVQKAMFEGGKQERDLAQKYAEYANHARLQWPRMARVLEKMAKEWEERACYEDGRAKQDEMSY